MLATTSRHSFRVVVRDNVVKTSAGVFVSVGKAHGFAEDVSSDLLSTGEVLGV